MRAAKNGPRALGLCFLAVAGLMAFGAAGAQGQSAGKFLDLVGGVATELAVGTTLTGAQEGNGSLLVPALGIAIECATIDTEEGVVTGSGVGHAKFLALNCITKTSGLGSLGACKIAQGALTARVRLLARLASAAHGNEPFILAEPLTEGQPYATTTIENETGKFCSISGTYSVTGTVAIKVLAGHVNPQLGIPYANQALLGDSGLKLGVNAATIDGSATAEINGPAGLVKAPFGVC